MPYYSHWRYLRLRNVSEDDKEMSSNGFQSLIFLGKKEFSFTFVPLLGTTKQMSWRLCCLFTIFLVSQFSNVFAFIFILLMIAVR